MSRQKNYKYCIHGFGKHQSFPRHKDTMDVLLQVKGRINVDVEEKIKTTTFINEKTGEKNIEVKFVQK